MIKIKDIMRMMFVASLVLSGLLLLFSLFYLRFLREHLPKEIPFMLKELKLYTIISILILYCVSIKHLIYPKEPSTFLIKLISFMQLPFIYFDAFIKHNKFVYPYYYKLFCKFGSINVSSFWLNDNTLLNILCNIIPRLILLLIFLVDVLYLNKIEIFYYFIFIGIVPIVYGYISYSIAFAIEQYIQQLEQHYTKVLLLEDGNLALNDMIIYDDDERKELLDKHNPNAKYHDEYVTIREYFEIQVELFLNYDKQDFTYTGRPIMQKVIMDHYLNNKYNLQDLTDDDYDKLHEIFYALENKIIRLKSYVQCDKKSQAASFIKVIKIILHIIYVLLWSYVLFKSIHTLTNIPYTLKVLKMLQEINASHDDENPFI